MILTHIKLGLGLKRENNQMTWRIERRRGKTVIVISTVPSKSVRRAKQRTQKRMLEIHRHFPEERIKNKPKCPTQNMQKEAVRNDV